MSIVTELKYTANLDKGVTMTPIVPSFMGGDQEAHRFVIDCYRQNSREAVDLSSAGVTAYFVRADGMTIPLTGEAEGSKASVLLPAACYAVMGRYSLVIKLSLDDGTADSINTVFWGEGAVSRSRTDVVIDPDSVIPSLEELLAQIEAMEIATNNANTAADNATQAATDATSTANAAAASAQATAKAAATQAVEIATAKGDEAVQIATEQVEAQNQTIAKIATDLLTKAPAIECEASGTLVTVTDAAAQPAVQLVTHIEPVQEGEGDPSPDNVRPISGWNKVQATNDTSGQTLTADLPETIYGGTLDWGTGVLTVGRTVYTVTGEENWLWNTSAERWECIVQASHQCTGTILHGCFDVACSHAKTTDDSSGIGVWMVPYSSDSVGLRWRQATDDGFANVDELKAYLAEQYAAGTPMQYVFKIATPYTIQLTPQQLSMLRGTNNLWSDTGDTDLVYVADTKMYIDQAIKAALNTTAEE